MKYHKNAKFDYFQRREIARRVNNGESVTKIAKEYNTTRKTVYKWARSEEYFDRPSRPKRFRHYINNHHQVINFLPRIDSIAQNF